MFMVWVKYFLCKCLDSLGDEGPPSYNHQRIKCATLFIRAKYGSQESLKFSRWLKSGESAPTGTEL